MATLAQVRERAAKRLGLLSVGQTLGAPINAHLASVYGEIHAEWTELNIAIWAETDDVPEHLVEPVVREMAYRCVDDYGVSDARYARITSQGGMVAERMLRRLINGEYEPDVTEFTDY